jgi:hypothetical protein
MMIFHLDAASVIPSFLAIGLGVIVPLVLSCLVLVVVIPSAAWRGNLSVPVYALMMFVSGFVAYGVGKLAGAESVRGTALGVVVSFIFFLLVATAAGCFFGIFFYRHRAEDLLSDSGEQKASSAVPALDEEHQ